MSASSNINCGGLVSFQVKVAGKVIPDEKRVYSIHIEKFVNKIPLAKVTILDGNAADGTFLGSSSKTFVPGQEITIEAGYDTENKTIFKGIITGQNIKVNDTVGSALEVECRDDAIKMIVGRKCKTYTKKKDSDIMSSIIKSYSGLKANVSATSGTWPEQIQYYVTDWDFILTRSEANGLIVTTLDGKISIKKPDADKSPVLKVLYGNNLLEFNADLNSITQLTAVKANAWDYKTQKLISSETKNNYSGPGNLASKKLADVVKLPDYELQTTAPLEKNDLTNWTKAQLVKSDYSKIQGEVKFQGKQINPGSYLTLEGLGDRFNGDHLISGIVHDISEGNWITEATIGLSPVWFTEEPDVMAPPTSGLIPGASGLFNGTVKKMNEDPDNQFRVLVDIPVFDEKGQGIWARLSNFYSTNGAGAFFLPEIGDEVVVGFLNEDPRFPIILGSIYSSSKNKPYKTLKPEKDNPLKAIVSKSGMFIEFNDKDKILTLETPKKNTIIFSDKDGKITLKDNNSNSIEMSSNGIKMKSSKNIDVDAGQKLTLKGKMGVKVESASGDVSIDGVNIKENAKMQYTAKGGMTAKINSGAQLALKSAMIMIN
ncbi:type VI secretion system tip protein VgrG [uncultured Winogradskyella sp.]|uniref:type VI secretion system tip protein VgrG n=1 Tax=uncultured Winogradskyella sp. TaxID=395353 RepID=UPI00261DDDD3|nr:type VI secretion system tip protein VgrG [uncultured Winogradskyella sp.]